MTRGRVLPKFLPELIREINRGKVRSEGTPWEAGRWMAARRSCREVRWTVLLTEKPQEQMGNKC